MTTVKFDRMPSGIEETNVSDIKNMVHQPWSDYEAKPEYKEFNKHDMIASMVHEHEHKKSSD